LIASRTATVRDGSAPAAAVRNGDVGTAAVWPAAVARPVGLAGWDASGVIIVYGISYMTWFEGKPDRRDVSTWGTARTKRGIHEQREVRSQWRPV
jgi:hypothetical protein